MIEVEGPDGAILEFPEGTSKTDMQAAMRKRYGQPRVDELRARVPEYARVGAPQRALQSATFNTLDEITGAVTAPFSVLKRSITGEDEGKPLGQRFGDAYRAQRDFTRDQFDLYQLENPGASLAADVVGGALVAGPAAAAARTTSTAANIGRGVAGGATFGAASAAGDARGGVDERLAAAGTGALLGGALGGAIPSAGALIGAASRPTRQAIRGYTNPREYAAQKVMERMDDANVSPQRAAGRLDKAAERTGQRLTLADVSGEGTRDLLRTASNIPGPARQKIEQKLTQRAAMQGTRVKRTVKELFEDPEAYGRTVDDIMRARTVEAKPFWDEARANPVPFTSRLEELLNRPAGKSALRRAATIAENEGVPFQSIFAQVDDAGNIINAQRVPDMRAWQYIKRGFDDIIEGSKTPINAFGATRMSDDGAAIQKLKRELLNELDRLNPAYAKARRVSMDAIELNEAVEFGRKALTMTPEQVRRQFKSLTPAQQDVARVGYAEALRNRIDEAGVTHDAVKRIFNTREQMDITKAMFGDNMTDYTRFRQAMMNEASMRRTYERVRGNSTTVRQAADLAEAGGLRDTVNTALTAATAGPGAAALQFIGNRMRMLGGFTPRVADEVQRILLETRPEKVRALAAELERIASSRASAAAKRQAVSNAISRATGIQADEALDVQGVESVNRPPVQYRP